MNYRLAYCLSCLRILSSIAGVMDKKYNLSVRFKPGTSNCAVGSTSRLSLGTNSSVVLRMNHEMYMHTS